MASEASKIRNQCAKKYCVREKAYKDKIQAMRQEIEFKDSLLEDYEELKKAYLKLVMFCGLNEQDRERVLRSAELNDAVGRYADLLGLNAEALRGIAQAVFAENGKLSINEVLEVMEQRGV